MENKVYETSNESPLFGSFTFNASKNARSCFQIEIVFKDLKQTYFSPWINFENEIIFSSFAECLQFNISSGRYKLRKEGESSISLTLQRNSFDPNSTLQVLLSTSAPSEKKLSQKVEAEDSLNMEETFTDLLPVDWIEDALPSADGNNVSASILLGGNTYFTYITADNEVKVVRDTLEKIGKLGDFGAAVSDLRVYPSGSPTYFYLLVALKNTEVFFSMVQPKESQIKPICAFQSEPGLEEEKTNALLLKYSEVDRRFLVSQFQKSTLVLYTKEGEESDSLETNLTFIETVEVVEQHSTHYIFVAQFCGDAVYCYDLFKKTQIVKLACDKTSFSLRPFFCGTKIFLLYSKNERNVAVFNVTDREEVASNQISEETISKLQLFSRRLGAASTVNGNLILFNLSSGQKVQQSYLSDEEIYDLNLLKNKKYGEGLVVSCSSGVIKLVVAGSKRNKKCCVF